MAVKGLVNALHVYFSGSLGASYDTLLDWMLGREVHEMPFNEADLSVNGQYLLLNATNFAGTIALGTTTATNGGWATAALSGAVGTAATTSISDTWGHVTNLCQVRSASSHDPILDANGREVQALLQAASTASDGDAVGASASENIQVSFVVVAADGTFSLTSVTAEIELSLPKVYRRLFRPSYVKAGVAPRTDVLSASSLLVRKYVVTTAFAADEIMTISTGAGSVAGAATPSGNSISSIGADSATFVAANTSRVRINGSQLDKTDVWESSTSIQLPVALSVGDKIEIEVQA